MNAGRGHKHVSKLDGSLTDHWEQIECGHCGRPVSAAVIAHYAHPQEPGRLPVAWLQCMNCGYGSVRNPSGKVSPALPFGPVIEGLPPDTGSAYEEARQAFSVGAYVATEQMCRKILMHVAVQKGAAENLTFAAYVKHLQDAGYVTPPMHSWVDQIRRNGNEATHELVAVTQQRAEGTLMFTAELLRLTYEMDAKAKQYSDSATTTGAD